METIQELHRWTANIMIIIFLYSSIMWFWLAKDKQKIGNASFRFLITLEMAISGLLLILGIGVIISNPSWFAKSGVYGKIALGLLAIGAIHMCAAKTKKFIQSDMDSKSIKPINIIRVATIFLLMTTYTIGHFLAIPKEHIDEVKEKIIDKDVGN